MTDDRLATLLDFFKAMANESRLRMVGLLAAGERSGQELAELLALKEPTVSHHLAVLRDLGVVTSRAEGVTRWHALDAEALTRLNRAMLEPGRVASLAPETESWEDKVLAGFLEPDGRLKVIPASRRKRAVVLAWLTRQFEAERRYPEAQVNALIQTRHPDCATLRRELIGHRMMARQDNIYWRLPETDWATG